MKINILGSGPSKIIPRKGCKCETCCGARKKGSKSRRMRSSVLIEHQGKNILIDCSPDFKIQKNSFLLFGTTVSKSKSIIDAVLLTHAHLDAAGGLKDLDKFAKKQQIKIPIYLLKQSARQIKSSQFKNLDFNFLKPVKQITIGKIKITPIPVLHGINLNYPTLAFRIDNIIYASDCAGVKNKYLKYFKSADTLFLDGSIWFGHQFKGHFNARDAIEFAKKIGAKKLYLTHIGHTFPLHQKAERKIKNYLKDKKINLDMKLTYDGMVIK